MTRMPARLVTTVSLLGLLGIASPLAQAGRPWVDPPADGGAAGQPASPSGAPAPAAGQPSGATAPAPRNDASSGVTEFGAASPSLRPARKPATSRSSPAVAQKRKASSPPAREARSRTPRRAGAALAERRAPATGSAFAGRGSEVAGSSRAQRVQEGLASGLELMTLRTIQLPDGRRVRVLTRPDPDAVSELLADHYR